MKQEIKDEAGSPDSASLEEVKSHKVEWQFRYRNYMEITNIPDMDVALTPSGVRPKRMIMARNWRLTLNLNDPKDKELNDSLMKSNQKNVSFWLLDGIKKSDTIVSRAKTLEEIMKMRREQLMNMVSYEEIKSAGLNPNNCSEMELRALIFSNKKMV